MNPLRHRTLAIAILTGALLATACSSSKPVGSSDTTLASAARETTASTVDAIATTAVGAPVTTVDAVTPGPAGSVTLLAYDAFVEPAALQAFTAKTGISVTVARAGDTGTMVNKALLTKGNPEGDVLWGIDNTLLSRALDEGLFEPYAATDLAAVDPRLTALVPGREVTPVDTGDVCLNYDIAWFTERQLDPPTGFADLITAPYNDLLIVENPATSSPGLAFLMATIAAYPNGEWESYWANLQGNGVTIVDDWNTAYYSEFTAGGGGGTHPIVVSYASSPPATIMFADDPKPTAPTIGTVESTCFRQVEFAGVLQGTKNQAAAHALIDFLISAEFQAQLPETNFVYPARAGVELPELFTKFAAPASAPATLPPDVIAAERDGWIEQWNLIVLD